MAALSWAPVASPIRLGGLGGTAETVLIPTSIRLTAEAGGQVVFHGHYAAVTDQEVLNMSVLGRDISNLFAMIVDRPGDTICLIGQQHSYRILQG